jgi:hypothetical protein
MEIGTTQRHRIGFSSEKIDKSTMSWWRLDTMLPAADVWIQTDPFFTTRGMAALFTRAAVAGFQREAKLKAVRVMHKDNIDGAWLQADFIEF